MTNYDFRILIMNCFIDKKIQTLEKSNFLDVKELKNKETSLLLKD